MTTQSIEGEMPPLPELTFSQWCDSLTTEQRYVFDTEGRGYKKDSGTLMRMAWDASRAPLLARVAELQAERDRIERNRDMWKGQCERQAEKLTGFNATVPALEIDAARYRMVRRGQHWSVIDGIGETLRADELDEQVDAALAAHKEQT